MTAAALLALAAGVCAVLGAWEALAVLERARLPDAFARAAEPLLRAGREGHAPTAAERWRLGLLAAASLLAGGWLLGGPPAGVLAALAGPALVLALVRARRRRYAEDVGRGAPACARALADALGAGHSVLGAIAHAAPALPGPAGRELRGAAAALALGEPLEVVLERLRRRARHPGWDTLVAAILLQRDAGGDLAGLLRELAGALEAAERSLRDARAVTAQARFTAWLVAGLPMGTALLAEAASPGWLERLVSHPLSAYCVVSPPFSRRWPSSACAGWRGLGCGRDGRAGLGAGVGRQAGAAGCRRDGGVGARARPRAGTAGGLRVTGASVLAGLAVASCVGGLAQLGARRASRTRTRSSGGCTCGARPGDCRCAVTAPQEAGSVRAGGPTPPLARLGAPASLLARAGGRVGGRLGLLRGGPRAVDATSRLQAAGLDPGYLPQLAAIRGGAALAGLGLAAVLAPSLPLRWMLVTALAAPAAGWLAPEVWLRRRARARARAIEAELADVLDLLRVTTAAGLPLQRSLSEVGRRHPGVPAGELGRAAAQLQLGEPGDAVIVALERRCPAAGVPALTAALARARRFGAPLSGTLAAQAEQARAGRAQQCAEAAARASPKIQLVVALLLVPSVLLLVAAALIPAVVVDR